MKTNKGFTLIELLVVIAIIGILSSVVLASLTTARTKGQDAALQSELSNMRAQAELYYSTNTNSNTYGTKLGVTTGCVGASTDLFGSTDASSLKVLLAGAVGLAAGVKTSCAVGGSSDTTYGSSWAMAAVLPSNSSKAFCVDSTGVSKTVDIATPGSAAGAVLSGTTAVCKP